MTTTSYCYLDSPIGRLLIAGAPGALSIIHFQGGRRPRQP